MNNQKKISIVIPCYNIGERILDLLRCIYNQYSAEVEIILINDGSTDKTAEIIESFINCHKEMTIYLFSFENKGAAHARKIGLSHATGEYVGFIDSDDMVSDDYINKLLIAIVQQPDIIYYSSIQQKKGQDDYNYKICFREDMVIADNKLFLSRQLENNYWTAAVWTYVFKRGLVTTSGAYFTNRSVHEDHLFSMLLLAYAKKIVIIKSVLYTQFITAGSLTNSKKGVAYVRSRYDAYQECLQVVSSQFNKAIVIQYRSWSLEQCYGIWREIYPLKKLVLNWGFWKMCFTAKDFGIFVFNKVFGRVLYIR